jgi:UDP-N-acetylenolpyruvoylglucosamine reductase
VFKNGEDFSARELIDKARLKESSAGDASISNKYANFIINRRNASSLDIKS